MGDYMIGHRYRCVYSSGIYNLRCLISSMTPYTMRYPSVSLLYGRYMDVCSCLNILWYMLTYSLCLSMSTSTGCILLLLL